MYDCINTGPVIESFSHTQYTHLRALSGHEQHSSSGINEILRGWHLTVLSIQLGNTVVHIYMIQRSAHALNHTRDGRPLLSSLREKQGNRKENLNLKPQGQTITVILLIPAQ